MDGYSVNEAAAVLGIPEGRVWELLARGVLAGSSEVGDDMRVFLRGAALVEVSQQTDSGSNGSNREGNGHGELSPFRELLTEFRTLTERYGQALLALGESRGEVASLRGRVDLLEARLDQRVPWSAGPAAAWAPVDGSDVAIHEAPSVTESTQEGEAETTPVAETTPAAELTPAAEPELPSEPDPDQEAEPETMSESEPTADAETESSADGEEPTAEADVMTKRARAASRSKSRSAISGFAEALARAEDPTSASVGEDFVDPDELPGSRETADAVAAYRRETMGDSDLAALVNEPEVEAPPSPVVRAGYNTDTPEPDWIAEEDLIVPRGMDASEVGDTAEPSTLSAADDEWPGDEPAIDETPAVAAPQMLTGESTEPTEASAQGVPDEPIQAAAIEPIEAVEPIEIEAVEAIAVIEPIEAVEPPEATAAIEPIEAVEPIDAVEPLEAIAAIEPIEAVEPLEAAEPAEPDLVASAWEAEEPERPQVAAVEIAAEPPASDDVALLVGPAAFAEPPIVPPEPAFWEPKARERAPFAIDEGGASDRWDPADAWDARDPWDAPGTEGRPAPTLTKLTEAPPALAEPAPLPAEPAPLPPDPPSPASEAPVWLEIPPSSADAELPRPGFEEVAPMTTPPNASPSTPRSARRRRGPAARAIRRLRLMLD